MHVAICILQLRSCTKLINRKHAIRVQCWTMEITISCTLLWLFRWGLSRWYSIPYQSSSAVLVSFHDTCRWRVSFIKSTKDRCGSLYNFAMNTKRETRFVRYEIPFAFHLRVNPIMHPLRHILSVYLHGFIHTVSWFLPAAQQIGAEYYWK